MGQLARLDRRGTCDSLDVAFAARALHLAGHAGAEAAFEILAKCRAEEADFIFWRDGDGVGAAAGGYASVRATALALLMYTDRGEMMADKGCCSVLSLQFKTYHLLLYTPIREHPLSTYAPRGRGVSKKCPTVFQSSIERWADGLEMSEM